MLLLIVVTSIVGFYDIIDSFLEGVSPWIIILATIILSQLYRWIKRTSQHRLGFGMTYPKVFIGRVLRLLRTYVPWVRR